MKKTFSIIVFFFAFSYFSSFAQYSYKPLRVELGWGISFPTDLKTGAVSSFHIEPKYSVLPKISVGVRAEANLFSLRGAEYPSVSKYEKGSFNRKESFSFLVTGDYHFTTGTFRPFVGLGLGVSHTVGVYTSRVHYYSLPYKLFPEHKRKEANLQYKLNLGGKIRAGFDVTHFRFAVEYNYAGYNHNLTFNHFGFTVGGYIGGRKVKNKDE